MDNKTYNIFIIVFVILIIAIIGIFLIPNNQSENKIVDSDVKINAPKVVFKGENGNIVVNLKENSEVLVVYKNGYLSSDKIKYSGTNVVIPFKSIWARS